MLTDMAAATATVAIDWRTWRQASRNMAWCLVSCIIADIGAIAFFQFTGVPRSTPAIMGLAVLNGRATSIFLETASLARQMNLRTGRSACPASR